MVDGLECGQLLPSIHDMAAIPAAVCAAPPETFLDRLNGPRHEAALRLVMVIGLAHWAEHLLQAFQIYALGWPVPEARGVLGYFYPWLIKSESLHYGYAGAVRIGLGAPP